ncbi:MAG: hybrid sensor histidine kinase/response regulator [Bacteroidota bacterium]|nr:hybrid sensor histidine kinase/response regulator [Candidatus Kapabacteria bacterium]MDW8220724.1 hybrid sensor histidine kinase/response regulator [Bacteroidota bacterium]
MHRVLIVDDIAESAGALAFALQRYGLHTTVCYGGIDALSLAQQEQPDIIVLDVAMPHIDGFEVARYLKSSPETCDIPIIFLTVLSDAARVVQGLSVGGSDYIRKPYSPDELFARIKTQLKLKDVKEQLRKRNQELEELNKQLSHLLKEKDELLRIVAHDLRSPISAISGIAEALLYNNGLSAEMRKELKETILATSNKMLAFVLQLLSVDAIERGVLLVQKQHFEVYTVLYELLRQYAYQAAEHNITFDLHIEDGATVVSDKMYVQHICENFITNALKYSPRGTTIHIRAYSRDAGQNGKMFRIEVQDEGRGLSDEEKKCLFAEHRRLSAQPDSIKNSTGLGLFIAKKLADSIGACVGYISEDGRGATFFLDIPDVHKSADFCTHTHTHTQAPRASS